MTQTVRNFRQLLGQGLTERASNMINDCAQFVNVRFADWLIGQGGYASAVENESSGEVD